MTSMEGVRRNARRIAAPVVALLLVAACGGGGGPDPLPAGAPLPTDPALLTMTFVGDTCGHGLVMDESASDPLANVGDLVPAPDVFVLNHEGVLTPPPHAPGACSPVPRNALLDAHPRLADFLLRAPFTVATLANNHAYDCGAAGIDATIAALSARAISVQGAGPDAVSACEPLRLG